MKRLDKSTDTYIMTNDPSMCAWGWAILNQSGKVIATGAIKTAKASNILVSRDRVLRVNLLATALSKIIRKYNVQYLLSELPHGSQSAPAAVMLGAVVGVLQTLSNVLGIEIEWYGEGDSKKNISGRRSLKNKDEMVRLISKHYEVIWQNVKWIDQAVADALAVHYIAIKQSEILKFIGK